jgi:hypothetical protein
MADTPPPTRAARAAREFMDSTSGQGYQQAIENAAILGGWVGSRQAGSRNVALSDAIAKAALDRVMDLFRKWAAECDPVLGEDGAETAREDDG